MAFKSVWLLLAAATPFCAWATDSDCGKAATPTEKAICADPTLQDMDRALADAWRKALAATQYHDELRADQRDWLGKRDNDCAAAVDCLRRYYTMRLPALSTEAVAGTFAWNGEWQRLGGAGRGAELKFLPGESGRIEVMIEAYNGGNVDTFVASAKQEGDHTVFRHDDYCVLTLRRVHSQLQVAQSGTEADCGKDVEVNFKGRYVRKGAPAPEWNLLTLGVVASPATDASIRTLLGAKDYQALLDRCNEYFDDADIPGFTTFAVNGLSTSMEAAMLQNASGQVQIAILDGDEIRYYSTDPASAGRPAGAFGPWLKRLAHPVRMVSVPGQPMLQVSGKDG